MATTINTRAITAFINNAQRTQNENETIGSLFGKDGSLSKFFDNFDLLEIFLSIKEDPSALIAESKNPLKPTKNFDADKFLQDVEAYLIEEGILVPEGVVAHEDEVLQEEEKEVLEAPTTEVEVKTETVVEETSVTEDPIKEEPVVEETQENEAQETELENPLINFFLENFDKLEAGEKVFDSKEHLKSVFEAVESDPSYASWLSAFEKESLRFQKEEEALFVETQKVAPVQEEVSLEILKEQFGSFAEVKEVQKPKAKKVEKPVENIQAPKVKLTEVNVSEAVKDVVKRNLEKAKSATKEFIKERVLPVGDERVLQVVKKNFRNSRNLPFDEKSSKALWRCICISTKKTDGQGNLTFHTNASLYDHRDRIVPCVGVALQNSENIPINNQQANIGIHANNFDFSPFAPSDKFPSSVKVKGGKIIFENQEIEFLEGILFSSFSIAERKGREGEKFTVINGKKDFSMRNAFIVKRDQSLMNIVHEGKAVFSLVGTIGNFKIYQAN